MKHFIESLQAILSKDTFFWFCALAGSGLFTLQFLLSLFGVGDDHDAFDAAHFKWLTKQTLTGFLMFFGWVGLTCKREFELSAVASAGWAIGGGLAAVFATALIFKMARKLHSAGTVFKIEETLGKEAVVYQRIPSHGSGKISISLHHHTYELDAISLNQEEIVSFTPVQIVKNMDNRTVIVIPKGR
ncbi:MAG: hypothetical protein JSS10_06285 [Verrucomicrobia bacterium]|nr:hypothetical protein [Verrucomicrobiota bacterium]